MPRARRSVEVRREEILAAAVGEITERGVGATRVADVARVLRVSPALVFYHFKTKDQLLAAAFEYAAQRDLDRLAAVLARPGPALARLKAVLRLYQPAGSGSTAWTLWVDGWAAALRSPDLRRASKRLDLRWKEGLAALIAEGVAAGEFDCADPQAAAWRITALMDGLSVQVTVHRGLVGRREAAGWAREQTARELGLKPDALD
ncbi:MAG TPA: TetR/AcrR family transcriptional regulator [Rugosimonospora sp.]|nr:TetR/AcrR family transcriptional regulator [Rugosimonospora sp.]